MKKLWIVILALALLVLPGCHSEMDDLLGTWQTELNIREVLAERLEAECPGIGDTVFIEALPVTLELTFYADGTYQAQLDPQSVHTAGQAIRPALEQGIWDYWVSRYRQKNPGGDLEAYLETLQVTRQELLDEVMGEYLSQELILQLDIFEEGQFSIEDGKLRFSQNLSDGPEKESWHSCHIKGNALTINPGEYENQRDASFYGKALPLTLWKK